MKSVYVVTYLNISLFPCGVNILKLGAANETQWTVCHHFTRSSVHKLGCPIRPIFSTTNTFNFNLAIFCPYLVTFN